MHRLTLQIESDLGNVSLVSLAVKAICLHAGVDPNAADQVELCIVEALTNSIRHAYHLESNHAISVKLSIDSEQLQFDICDRGTPMNPSQIEQLIQGDKTEEPETIDRDHLPEGGRGLQIIRRTMDEVAYTHEANQNRLTLIKRINRNHAAESIQLQSS